jgi:hypothetical protein
MTPIVQLMIHMELPADDLILNEHCSYDAQHWSWQSETQSFLAKPSPGFWQSDLQLETQRRKEGSFLVPCLGSLGLAAVGLFPDLYVNKGFFASAAIAVSIGPKAKTEVISMALAHLKLVRSWLCAELFAIYWCSSGPKAVMFCTAKRAQRSETRNLILVEKVTLGFQKLPNSLYVSKALERDHSCSFLRALFLQNSRSKLQEM